MDIESKVTEYIKSSPEIITPLGKIKVGKRINSGGTSVVYQAELENYDGLFVIKLLLENVAFKETSAFRRFKHTFINLQLVQNVDIFLPQIYFHKINISDEFVIPFTIQPYAEYTLFSYLKDKEITFDFWFKIFNTVGQKIEKMHNLNIIHRDLKPQNLFIMNKNVLIGDCDIASFKDNKYMKLVETKPSDRLGNYSFSAPEQADKNIDEISPAADWYAFGQIMYWLVHKTTVRGFQSIDLNFDQPIFNDVIEKLLSQNPNDRFQSFNEIKNYIVFAHGEGRRKKELEKQYKEAINTTELFDEIVIKYTFETSASIPFIKTISKRDEINDIIGFLQSNCKNLSLWLTQGYPSIEIKEISIDYKNENYLFNWYEMKIEKLIIFRLGVYPGGSLIIVITEPQQSVLSLNENTYESEEVCYYKEKIITRPEYDNGWTIIDGQRIKISSEDTEIKIRTLNRTVYFISPKNGLFKENTEILNTIHKNFQNDNTLDEDYFFKILQNAKRADIVKMYD